MLWGGIRSIPGPRGISLNQVVQRVCVDSLRVHIWIIPDDSHYFCALVPELFSLVQMSGRSMSSAEAAAMEQLASGSELASTAAGLRTAGRPRTRGLTRSQAVGSGGNDGSIGDAEEEAEEHVDPGASLQSLFREPPRDQAPMWRDADMVSGSAAADDLVASQRANRMVICAKAIMASPQVIPGVVFITMVERAAVHHNVIWQIVQFQEAAQVFVAHRVSAHAENLLFPEKATFSVSTVEVLISPTLPFLNQVLDAMGPSKQITVSRFPIPDKIVVPSAPIVNMSNRSMEFELRHFDGSFKARLTVPMPEREGTQVTSATGDLTEASRRVKAVPAGTHHWYLCDDCMLMGSRSEELVYSVMIHGGARSAPGAGMQLGIGLLLRMNPKDARNILSLRITSSTSFDTVTESELLSLRYGGDKSDVSKFQLGDCARLAYRRVCNCQEILFRLFQLKPRVMAVWSAFAAQILDIIENGAVRYPGIATNGVIGRYVELVLQTFFSQLHAPGLTAIGSDAALALLCLDTTSEVFTRYQLDAEFRQHRGHGVKRGSSEGTVVSEVRGDPPAKKPKQQGEKKKSSSYCFAFFAVEGCTRGSACRFSHTKPVVEPDKDVIRAGVLQRSGTLQADAF